MHSGSCLTVWAMLTALPVYADVVTYDNSAWTFHWGFGSLGQPPSATESMLDVTRPPTQENTDGARHLVYSPWVPPPGEDYTHYYAYGWEETHIVHAHVGETIGPGTIFASEPFYLGEWDRGGFHPAPGLGSTVYLGVRQPRPGGRIHYGWIELIPTGGSLGYRAKRWAYESDSHTPIVIPCYANCDQSTTSPVLNVADFTCFLQRFAAGDLYANCDASSTYAPVLNVADFTCFLQRYAAGCP
jgi:hypothetical protein